MSLAGSPPVDESATCELIVERLPFGVAVLDEALRIVSANPAFAALSDFTVTNVIGRTITEIFPQFAAALRSSLMTMVQGGYPVLDATLTSEARDVLLSVLPLPSGMAVVMRAAPSRNAEEGAADQASVFHAIFEYAAIGLIAFEWQGSRARVNPAMLGMLGYTEEEFLQIGIEGVTHPEDFARDREQFQRLMSGEIDHYQIDKRYLRKGGELFWGRLVVSLARNANGDPILVIGMIEDVTEKRRSDAEREKTIRALEEAVRAREVFLSIASHELKTPLTSLKIHLEILRKGLADDSTERTRTENAIKQVNRLGILVEKLLDVSRIATGQLALTRERLDLREVARELITRMQVEAAQAGSVLVLSAPESVHVVADRLRLEQVLANLTSNAIKFGAGKPIDIEVGQVGKLVRIGVRDHGIGIALEEQQRIFGRFERAAPELSFGGLGLGLYISREIVEAHGGSIRVESQPGQGASFYIELPCAE